MYTSNEVAEHEGKLSFTPNTLTYNVAKNTPEGRRILKSKLGLAPHTEYEKLENGKLQAKFGISLDDFKKQDDVYLLDPKVAGPFKYPLAHQKRFMQHMKNAADSHRKLNTDENREIIKNHEKLLLGYINHAIRNKKDHSLEGYIAFINKRFTDRLDNVKMDKTKDSIRKELNKELQNLGTNRAVFDTLFKTHKEIQNAKHILIDVLSKNSPYGETILGSPSKPEGYVVSINNFPMKLVDRHHFSHANFEWNEKVNPDDNPVVMSWGRFNPITKGHEKLINKGADIARRTGAKQLTVATATHDKNNPLPPQEKLKWMKNLFPGQDVALAGKEAHTIIAQLQQLHHKGVKDVTIVAGEDRVPEYTRILSKYNGPGKLFQFNRARVVSSGERDPDGEGDEGVSASKVRKAARQENYKDFKKGMPSHVDHKKAKEMFHTLRAEMGLVRIGADTDGHALAIFAKRAPGDKIGNQAKLEIMRRKKLGKWYGK
jgi:phosphopantetheine adenylyltransferase